MEQRHPLHRDKPIISLFKALSYFKRKRSHILHSLLLSDNNLPLLLDHIHLLYIHDEARQSKDSVDVSFSIGNSVKFNRPSDVPSVFGNFNIN